MTQNGVREIAGYSATSPRPLMHTSVAELEAVVGFPLR